MDTFHINWVEPVNGGGSQPVLTLDEVWQGCLLLARSPQTFTSVISSCVLTSDAGNTLTRTLYFSEGPQAKMEQSISLIEGSKFECQSDSGNRVTTMVLRGLSGTAENVYLSIEYAIPYSNLEPDAERMKESYAAKAKRNLVDGLKTMRELKAQGKLG